MEKNNTQYAFYVIFLLVGLLVGWFAWATPNMKMSDSGGVHVMEDGSLMSGDMHSMMADMNQNLRGKTGDDFDIVFLEEMIVHHQGALDMANLAIKNAKHKEIVDLANAIITSQSEEINKMKAWQSSWYK